MIEAAWKDVAVTDNSLDQAISSLRRTLGVLEGEMPYIETLARRGYRFRTALDDSLRELGLHGAVMKAAIAEAVYETIVCEAARAAETVGAALQQLPAGSSGWMIPIDPLLQVGAHGGTWEGVLTLLRSRAA